MAWSYHSGHNRKRPGDFVFKTSSQSTVAGQLHVRVGKLGRITRTSAQMPSWGTETDQISTQEEMDLIRTDCLSQWTAFCNDLDTEQQGSLGRDPAASEAAALGQTSGVETWLRAVPELATAEPASNPNQATLEQITKELNYLRLWHEPIVVDKETVDLRGMSVRGRTEEEAREKAVKKVLKEKRKAKEAEKGPDVFDGQPEVHDRCLLFATSGGHLGQSQGNVQPGDGLYLVQGSAFPLVLSRSAKRKEYVVVGKARIFKAPTGEGGNHLDSNTLSDDPKSHEIVLV